MGEQNPEPGAQSLGWDKRYTVDGGSVYIPGEVERYGEGGLTVKESCLLSYERSGVVSAIDFKSEKVEGESIQVGTFIDMVLTIGSDGDIQKYGMAGAERRVKADLIQI